MRAEDGGIYRRSSTRDFRKRYYLAFEGYTEYQYFRGLKANKTDPLVRIPGAVDIQCLSRFDQNAGDSNPLNIEGAMADYMHLIRTGTYTAELFVYTLIQDVYSRFCQKLPKSRRKGCGSALHNLQSDLISRLLDSDLVKGRYVDDSCWEEATECCRGWIEQSDFNGCGEYISVPKDRKVETYDEDADVFCLIADRDRGSNTAERYSLLVDSCRRQNIRLYVSNPCFEFWLMLHFDSTLGLAERECDAILANAKKESGGVRRSYCECRLTEMVGSYSKTDVDFERDFMQNLNGAIENAESFETELEKLENRLGSNVGRLITEMRQS